MRTRSEPTSALLNREGRGRALVVRSEAGVGKSALLEYAAGATRGSRRARRAGRARGGRRGPVRPVIVTTTDSKLSGLPGRQRPPAATGGRCEDALAPVRDQRKLTLGVASNRLVRCFDLDTDPCSGAPDLVRAKMGRCWMHPEYLVANLE
jgi:hypothetical protein